MKITAHRWLITLSLIPLIAGMSRLAGLALGETPGPGDQRFFAAPWPVTVHIVSATFFCIAGAFQFDGDHRRRHPSLHRAVGRIAGFCGVLAASSGVWMALSYAIPRGLQGDLLLWVRSLVGFAMAVSLVLAVLAIRARNILDHQAWMVRAYALAQGTGTQALLFIPPALFVGEITGFLRDVMMTLAWVLNLTVAEVLLRRSRLRQDHATYPWPDATRQPTWIGQPAHASDRELR